MCCVCNSNEVYKYNYGSGNFSVLSDFVISNWDTCKSCYNTIRQDLYNKSIKQSDKYIYSIPTVSMASYYYAYKSQSNNKTLITTAVLTPLDASRLNVYTLEEMREGAGLIQSQLEELLKFEQLWEVTTIPKSFVMDEKNANYAFEASYATYNEKNDVIDDIPDKVKAYFTDMVIAEAKNNIHYLDEIALKIVKKKIKNFTTKGDVKYSNMRSIFNERLGALNYAGLKNTNEQNLIIELEEVMKKYLDGKPNYNGYSEPLVA